MVAWGDVPLLLSVAGLAGATVLTVRAYEREHQKAQEADEQRVHAEESFRQAREAVDQFVQIGEDEPAGNPAVQALRRQLLEAALTYYQAFLDQHRDDPRIQADLEASRDKMKDILGELATLMGASKYIPLRQQEVQDELKLSPDQRDAIAAIAEKWRGLIPKLPQLKPSDRERRGVGLMPRHENGVRLPTPEQHPPFHQNATQLLCPPAFAHPDRARG